MNNKGFLMFLAPLLTPTLISLVGIAIGIFAVGGAVTTTAWALEKTIVPLITSLVFLAMIVLCTIYAASMLRLGNKTGYIFLALTVAFILSFMLYSGAFKSAASFAVGGGQTSTSVQSIGISPELLFSAQVINVDTDTTLWQSEWLPYILTGLFITAVVFMVIGYYTSRNKLKRRG